MKQVGHSLHKLYFPGRQSLLFYTGTFHSRWRKECRIDVQEKHKKSLPGILTQTRRVLCNVLQSAQHTMTQNCLPVDNVWSWRIEGNKKSCKTFKGPSHISHFYIDGGCHYIVVRNETHVFLWMPTNNSVFSGLEKNTNHFISHETVAYHYNYYLTDDGSNKHPTISW